MEANISRVFNFLIQYLKAISFIKHTSLLLVVLMIALLFWTLKPSSFSFNDPWPTFDSMVPSFDDDMINKWSSPVRRERGKYDSSPLYEFVYPNKRLAEIEVHLLPEKFIERKKRRMWGKTSISLLVWDAGYRRSNQHSNGNITGWMSGWSPLIKGEHSLYIIYLRSALSHALSHAIYQTIEQEPRGYNPAKCVVAYTNEIKYAQLVKSIRISRSYPYHDRIVICGVCVPSSTIRKQSQTTQRHWPYVKQMDRQIQLRTHW